MAHLLEAQGTALREGVTGEWNKFMVKARKRGSDAEGVTQAVLVAFDGPSKPIIKFQYKPDTVIVLYKPAVSGDYTLDISKGGEKVPGSPFKCTIRGILEVHPEKIKVSGHGLHRGIVNQINEIFIDYIETNITGKIKVSMEGPTFPMLKYGKPDLTIVETGDSVRKIKYTPKFAGKYKLHVGFDNGPTIPGSPWPIEVVEKDKV